MLVSKTLLEMKKMKQLSAALILLVIASSCSDYLEPTPITFVDQDDFFENDADFEVGILNIYEGLQGTNDDQIAGFRSTQIEYILTEMRTDNTKARSGGDVTSDFQQFEVYEVDPSNIVVQNYYESMYNVIFRSNLILDELDAASDSLRGGFEGEAKFVRAYSYFQMVRLFGAVPMPLSVITPDSVEISFTRIAEEVVYDQIVDDLLVSIANLSDGDATRASKSGAQALLAKVYLTMASLGETAYYEQARSLCEDIISSGLFDLHEDYASVFTSELNEEVIFVIPYLEGSIETSQNFSWEWSDQADRRLNYTTENIREKWEERGETARALFAQSERTSQYMNTKYTTNNPSVPRQSGNDWVVLRYADVLLMYVEAVLAGGESTSDATALDYYNQVRARAGFETAVSTISKADLLEERRMELSFENQRLFDLIRFEEEINVLSDHADNTGGIFSNTDVLLPIPQNEINLSGTVEMRQNPGY